MRRVVWLSSFALGCVNDYVVRDDDGAGGTGTGSSTSGASQDQTSGTTMPDPDTGTLAADSSSDDGGDPSTSGAGDTGLPQFICEPCTADDQCGDDFDNCVDLDGDGLRCVFSCPEGGCPPDLDCAATTSVDGVMSVQCVPIAPMC